MEHYTARTASKIARRGKRAARLQSLFDYVRKQIEAPLTMGNINDKSRRGHVEVKCTKHDRVIKIKEKKQLQKEDLVLCKSCNKKIKSVSMLKEMQVFDAKMVEKYTVNKSSKITLKGLIKKDISNYMREIKGVKTAKITPEMIKTGMEDYIKRGGKITKIG